MTRLILDQESMGLSLLMERVTRAKVKDCFTDEEGTIFFVVASGEAGKAIGKGASNIKRLQQELQRKIRVIEYSDDVVGFVKNIIYPHRVQSIKEESEAVIINETNKKAKSLLIGRQGRNLKLINRAVKRFFNLEVKVI
ncbi:MAG TPA: NusA-like transcription termination signal-binding factor [Candidatus Nanoarchaeia archaeon]|nr:NusA-like transcription termination signal-binding factor [Candidatus Nanoarchaeia archaeon]